MRLIMIRLFAACLVTAAAGNTLAKPDIEDEDLSYIANHVPPRYGYDKAVNDKCVQQGRSKAQSPEQLKALTDNCRVMATPRKCRSVTAELPPSLSAPTPEIKSPQQVCAATCMAVGKGAGKAADCALN